MLTDDGHLREFRDPYWFAGWDDYAASAVVQPASVEEVQAIVRIANERKVRALDPRRGRNNGYGGPAPRLNGSVLVSLRKMNRVLEIDEECAYAVVEPGVRWFDLYDAIQSGGHKLWVSIADLGWGSVIGNYARQRRHVLSLTATTWSVSAAWRSCSPNGELVRTGMGAMLDNNGAWHVYKRGLGPTPDQLFMQSNFGIVTKMGVWLMPEPECYLPGWVMVSRDDDLGAMVDTLRELMLGGSITGYPMILSPVAAASVFTDRAHWYDGEGVLPEEAIERISSELGFGRWTMRFALYGDEAVVDHRFAKIKEAFERIPGAEVIGTKYAPEADDARAPGRARPGRRAESRARADGKVVRRRGGRPHRLLAGGAAHRRATRSRLRDLLRPRSPSAGSTTSRGAHPHQRAQLHPRRPGHLRHQGRGADARGVRRLEGARARGGEARLRRVPGAPRLHGPRR